jgi:hypothetical protein
MGFPPLALASTQPLCRLEVVGAVLMSRNGPNRSMVDG